MAPANAAAPEKPEEGAGSSGENKGNTSGETTEFSEGEEVHPREKKKRKTTEDDDDQETVERGKADDEHPEGERSTSVKREGADGEPDEPSEESGESQVKEVGM